MGETCMPQRKLSLMFTIWYHIWAMFWLYWGNFLAFSNIFASWCLKWLIFSRKSHACHQKLLFSVDLLGPYWWHAIAILGQCFVYFYNIYLHLYVVNVLNFSWRVKHAKWKKTLVVENLDHIKALFGSYQGHVLAIYTIYIFLEVWNGSNFLCIAM